MPYTSKIWSAISRFIKGATKLQVKNVVFVTDRKIGENSQHFKAAVFHNESTLCHVKPNIYVEKTKFSSHNQYLFRLLSSRNAKRIEQTKVYHTFFYFVSTKKWPTNLCGSCKNPFLQCMLLVQLASMNVFYSMW